ncbi:MAG: Lrp/AsnC family transcriptional regulator [Fretibacterium sp.]|nr:Lrp/AsnC family transcriptional regulator [Fretibacterium sp.]
MKNEQGQKNIKIDALSIDIIKELSRGGQPMAQIAAKLKVSEGTVRNRINKLERAGILDRCGLADMEALPGHMVILVGIKLTTPHLLDKAEELKGLRGVVSSLVVTGSYDIFLVVILNEDFGLLEFFNEEFARHSEGVQTTDTFVIYKSFGFKLPYVL